MCFANVVSGFSRTLVLVADEPGEIALGALALVPQAGSIGFSTSATCSCTEGGASRSGSSCRACRFFTTQRGRPIIRSRVITQLPQEPDRSDVDVHLEPNIAPVLTEDMRQTVEGAMGSVRMLIEALAEQLGAAWDWRKAHPDALHQPRAQWPRVGSEARANRTDSDAPHVPGYHGIYNFRDQFWVTTGSRIPAPLAHMTLNIGQDLAEDLQIARQRVGRSPNAPLADRAGRPGHPRIQVEYGVGSCLRDLGIRRKRHTDVASIFQSAEFQDRCGAAR
jgi:hypothetical protein